MPEIPNLPADLLSSPGIEMKAPPGSVLGETNRMIRDAVAAIGKDRSGVLTVWVDTTTGVNAALAHKVREDVYIVGYFGKEWGQPIRAGIAGQIEW